MRYSNEQKQLEIEILFRHKPVKLGKLSIEKMGFN